MSATALSTVTIPYSGVKEVAGLLDHIDHGKIAAEGGFTQQRAAGKAVYRTHTHLVVVEGQAEYIRQEEQCLVLGEVLGGSSDVYIVSVDLLDLALWSSLVDRSTDAVLAEGHGGVRVSE